MPLTTPGRLLLAKTLPPGMWKEGDVFDKKTVSSTMMNLAEKAPDRYIDVLQDMLTHSREAAYRAGRLASVSPYDLVPPKEVKAIQDEMRAVVRSIAQDPDLDTEEKNKKIVEYVTSKTPTLNDDVMNAAAKAGNRLALYVKNGFRGDKNQLQQIMFGDAMNADYKGRPIPIPVLTGYGQGVSPVQYWSGAYSARKGDVDTQFATAETGYFCLSPDTLVMMGDKTSRRLGDIREGDVVMGSDLRGVTAPARVSKVFDNGERQCRHYTLLGSDETEHRIVATPSHKVLSRPSIGFRTNPVMRPLLVCEEFDHTLLGGLFDDVRSTFRVIHSFHVGAIPTLDIEVENEDHLYVLACGLVVSNSKQMATMAQKAVVSEEDCGTANGVVRDGSDPDVVGAVLARDAHGYKAGDVVTRAMAKEIGEKPLVVRTTMSCQAAGGVCQKCSGVRDARSFPKIGSYLGIEAGRIVTEPLTQGMALNSKHIGGTAGVNEKNMGAFQEINQFVNTPSTFVNGAALAPVDGVVSKVEDAPQGGKYIHIGEHRVYADPGLSPSVKAGDKVEAGDRLSDGMMNLRAYAALRGVGEARKMFADGFHALLKEKGQGTSRKNVDILARELVNRVRITDPDGVAGYEVGEEAGYDDLARNWTPPDDTEETLPSKGVGRYLQRPVLHYTIGTRVTPAVATSIANSGYGTVAVSAKAPGFEPVIRRMIDIPAQDSDWITRLSGWNTKRSFVDAVQKGLSSKPGTSYARKMYLPEELGEDDED
jgi:hypothetical protein